MLNSKYKDQEYHSTLSNSMKSKYISMLHLNISFLQNNLIILNVFLDEMKLQLDFIIITESITLETQSPSNNINLPNY